MIGLNFTASNENLSEAGPAIVLREERVNFYLFEDNGIKFAGSVLKVREEPPAQGAGGAKEVYNGAIVFKKDMKGNIIGILSPYTVTSGETRIEKGMVRYDWDIEKEIFMKE